MSHTPKTILLMDRASARSIWSLLVPVAEAALARGDRVVAVLWDDGSTDHATPLLEPHDGIERHAIAVGPKHRPWDVVAQHRRFAAALRPLLDATQPDVVHVNFAVPGALAARIALKRCPDTRILAAKHELFGSMSPHLRALTRWGDRVADVVVHVSRAVADSYGASPDDPRHVVIPNGIDTETLRGWAAEHAVPDDGRKRCLVVGRMVPVKGQTLALEAFARAAAHDPALELELIGEGPDAEALRARARALGLADRVHLPGWLPQAKVAARMASAHAVMIPSDGTQEGFGLVLAEAMALGARVLASDIAAFREVAGFGEGVVLLTPMKVEPWTDALSEPLPLATSIDGLSLKVMGERYLSLYEGDPTERRTSAVSR